MTKENQAALNSEQIIGAIEQMTVLELAEMIKKMEEKFGVTAAMMAPAGAAAPAASADAPAAAEEKSEVSLILTVVGEKKIQVIKVVREVTGLGLKEAKDLVDGAPKPVKEGISPADAEEIKKKFVAVGATVEIK
ncbi:MAG: 50S ribosomal protein L7/L12 [Proteobacteria bacterium]|nr:50S ribosomal protein L7/L12 [Pseudomonadota bacterium]